MIAAQKDGHRFVGDLDCHGHRPSTMRLCGMSITNKASNSGRA
jgi:hypothetical protein